LEGAVRSSDPVDSIPQLSGTLEGDDFSFSQDQILSGGRISAPAFILVLYTKFSESRYQHIITLFKGRFDDLKQGFDDFDRFFLSEAQFVNAQDNIIFSQCHAASSSQMMKKII
jgi:hypothetical protein